MRMETWRILEIKLDMSSISPREGRIVALTLKPPACPQLASGQVFGAKRLELYRIARFRCTARKNVGSANAIGGTKPPLACVSRTDSLRVEQHVDDAWAEFNKQSRSSQLPSFAQCDELILALCASKRLTEAHAVYSSINERGGTLKYNTYQALLNACLVLGDLDGALAVFRDLQSCGMAPNKVTFCGLISALGKQKRRGSRYLELAYELWRELQLSGDNLDPMALRIGMKACVDTGRMEDAERIVEAMENGSSSSPSPKAAARDVRTYNILLKGYAKAGDRRALQEVLERMKKADVKPSCVTYNTLVSAHVRIGALDEARNAMEDAILNDVQLDAWSYSSLLKGCVQGGDLAGAVRVIDEMRRVGIKPTYITYSTLVDGYVRDGDLETALQLVDDMIADGEQPSAVTYNSLLKGYASSQRPNALQQGLRILDDMQLRGVRPEVDTFNTLMSASVAVDDAELALELHRRLQDAGLRPDGLTYTVLIQAHARLGRVSDAVATFEALSRDRNAAMDSAVYNAMADVFARVGEMEAAEKMLASSCAFARHRGLPPPVEAFGAVVTGYVKLKQVNHAVDAVRRFHSAGGTPDIRMLDQLVDLCVRTGEFKVAMQAVRAVELMGTEIDKHKYKTLMMNMMRRQERVTAPSGRRKGSTTFSSSAGQRTNNQRRRQEGTKAVHLERFKFWLGLPNSYYDSDES